jgi:hypothetical protein
VVVEEAEQAPEAGARAVLVLGLAVVVALVDARLGRVLAQVGFGNAVAGEDGALTSLLIMLRAGEAGDGDGRTSS